MRSLMCVIILFLCQWSSCGAISKSNMDEAERYRNMPRVDFSLADAQKGDVIYKYFEDAADAEGKFVTEESLRNGEGKTLNKSLPTVLLIHGWTTDDTSPWYKPLKDGLFALGPHNVVYVNWSKAGNKSYRVSSANIKPVGRFIAQFLVSSGVPPGNVQLIGHSLGSHLAGFVGKSTFELTGKKLGRITAPDPAGPMFAAPEMAAQERLCESDADFVDVVHTDVGLYGYAAPLGHVDFYPNGGGHQPGCPPRNEADNCSHARSTVYLIESLTIKFKAYEATYEENNFNVTVAVKPRAKELIFGQHVDKNSRGVYYLETNAEKPYLS
ncbi:unnamed protein product [Phaedon cochleariae]|uniref:Lipase domain-containing protein n=1 Tax=Phaedon cochleariae TaxID=80249 RepID=A0A9P0GRJ3_PHACE|nr:unnamed protein product [Phaedon cochleariae]